MHGWTQELLTHLERSREQLLAAVAAVPERSRERSPGAGAWSVANVLAHLARTEGQVAALLEKRSRPLLQARAGASRPSSDGSIVACFDGAPVLDRSEPLQAPAFAAPDLSMTAAIAERRLSRARARLTSVVVRGDGVDLRRAQQAHHVFGELDFYQWVLFAGYHEQRHAAQVLDVAGALRDA
ncbi:MAG: DinB family protein [Planctomycetota bacterium]